MHPVDRVIRDGLCLSCGMCAASSPDVAERLAYDREWDQFVPVVREAGEGRPEPVCPGAGVDMNALSMQVHGRLPSDYLLGVYRKIRVCHATDEQVRRQAASGGVIPTVLRYLFDRGRIDEAYCVVPGEGPYDAHGRIIRSPEELEQTHGSVYHPCDYGRELRQLLWRDSGRFAIVGLPCHLEGFEMIKARRPELADRHVLSLGLFCGGVNRFEAMAYYLGSLGVPWDDVARIEYRYGPWPGSLRVVRRSSGEEHVLPRIQGNTRHRILRYVAAMQGYWMLKRCRICPDQISDFADIAVGDPHLPRYRRESGPGHSLVISRTERGEDVLRRLIDTRVLAAEETDREAVVQSQSYCLDNRRHAPAYLSAARLLGEPVPTVSVYPQTYRGLKVRHHKWAVVDLGKIMLRRQRWLRPLYPWWQAFEYLFISFYPDLLLRRAAGLLLNKRKR